MQGHGNTEEEKLRNKKRYFLLIGKIDDEMSKMYCSISCHKHGTAEKFW